MKTIEIVVSPDGKSTVQTRGFTGSSCRDASKFLEQTLGSRLGEQVTAEFHLTESAQERQQQRS